MAEIPKPPPGFDIVPPPPEGFTQEQYAIDAKVGGQQTGSTDPGTGKTYDPYGSLPNNFMGGLSDVAEGVQQAVSNIAPGLFHALMPPDPMNPGSSTEGLVQAVAGIGQTIAGAGRAIFSPIQAAGDAAGEITGETARSGAQSLGASPDVAAAIGTAIGAPINAAIQLWAAPYAIAKAAPKLMQVVQAGVSKLPGAQVTLRNMAQKAVEAWPTKMLPPMPSKNLYDRLAQINPKLEMPELNAIAKKLDALETIRSEFGVENTGVQTAARKIAEATSGGAPGAYKEISFDVAQTLRQRIGARIGELRRSGGEQLGEYKQLYEGLTQSLENAAENSSQPLKAQAAFALLKRANKAANTEFSVGELQDIITKNVGKALEGQDFTSKNFAKALNDVNVLDGKNPLFRQGLGDKNFKTIQDNLTEFAKLRLNPAPKSVDAGSKLLALRGSAGYLIGKAIGGHEMGMTLAAASVVTPPILSRVIQSKAGTHALIDILQRTGTITPSNVASIMAIIRGEQAMAENMPDAVTRALQGKDMSIDEKIQAVNMQDTIIKTAEQAKRDLGQTYEGRPVVKNPDGSWSHERSITIEANGQHMNIPTMFGGKQVPPDKAVDIMRKNNWTDPDTGKRVQTYKTHEDALTAARRKEAAQQ